MRILMAWAKAKLQASGTLKNQKGVVMIEYLALAAGIIGAVGVVSGAIQTYFETLGTKFEDLAESL